MKDELKSLKEDISVLSSRVDKLEKDNRILLKANEELSKQKKTQQSIDDDQIGSVMREVEQRYLRRKNVIIRGLPEQETGSPPQRHVADLGNVLDIFCSIGIDNPVTKDRLVSERLFMIVRVC